MKATEPSDTRSSESDLRAALEFNSRDMRERYRLEPEPWWVIMPLRYLATVDERKREYVESGWHGWQGLTGIQFVGNGFGQTHTFTYDSDKKEWNR